MKQQGRIILLTASAKNIYKRVKDSTTRPLLNNNMTIEHIDKLMESRKEKYLKAADIIINTDNKTIEEICKDIIKNEFMNDFEKDIITKIFIEHKSISRTSAELFKNRKSIKKVINTKI